MYIFAHKYFCISRPFPFWCKGTVGSCKQTWVGMSGCVNILTWPCTSRSRREKMKPSIQRVERKGFSSWKPVCSDDDLLLQREFNCYAAVATSCCCCWFLFVCFILNSLSRFLCLARLFSFKTHLCSNGFQHGLRAILSQHPAPISIFAISLLC